ncbi:hypothetical protein CRG98_003301 [Punica granatum]|uniref:Tf2-1-like SH3-like domain-containing protein n=1 Tax=Punica granatum TaxID=22663 RepID=A0A2I0L6F1_PUNGR|nr:hypothetical protein CRG98_003301 [Punica granatum]
MTIRGRILSTQGRMLQQKTLQAGIGGCSSGIRARINGSVTVTRVDRFSAGDYHKLAARMIGPVEIVEKINANAYRLKLPSHIRTADVFNVKHLIPYTGDSSDDDDSRTNSLHAGENDAAEDLDRFSAGDYHKLAARMIGPVEIVEKINANAYRLKLPSHIRTADVFNVKHLIPYTGDSSDDDDSRTNSLHAGENDAAEDLASRYLKNYRF